MRPCDFGTGDGGERHSSFTASYEDDGPRVQGQHLHEPPDHASEPPAGADAQDLPIVGDVEGVQRGGGRSRTQRQGSWTAAVHGGSGGLAGRPRAPWRREEAASA